MTAVQEAPHELALRRVDDNVTLGDLGPRLMAAGLAVGLMALGGAAAFGLAHDGARRLLFAYLVSFAFWLSLALGALFFVLLQHLTRAGWSVAVRRLAEVTAATMPLLGLLGLVVVVPVALGRGDLYPWADSHAGADALAGGKAAYLNAPFFLGRYTLYFVIWSLLAAQQLRRSSRQDVSRQARETQRLEAASGAGMVLFAITTTFAAFDLLMSLVPTWCSTIFGVYYFAGSVVGFFAWIVLVTLLLQRTGRLAASVTTEHYHDLAKLLFAFVFFWAYIAFSQFMLIWYANLPEETAFFRPRMQGSWALASLVLILGHFALPFAGLLSRPAKRHRAWIGFWAAWLLVMHWFDLAWIVLPSLQPAGLALGAVDGLCFVGLGGLFIAAAAFIARRRALMPLGDPRLAESLLLENM
jgi:hypothetical protein